MSDKSKGPDAPAAGRTKPARKASATKAPAKRTTRAKKADDAPEQVGTAAAPIERDAREIPGYTWKEVKHPELNVVERVQVFDPQLAEEQGVTGENREADLMNKQAQTTADAVAKAASPQE